MMLHQYDGRINTLCTIINFSRWWLVLMGMDHCSIGRNFGMGCP